MIALSDYLILAAILFGLSVAGIFLNRKNVIILLMAIELMLLAVNMNFIAFSYFLGDTAGQVFVFFILTVAAAEAAIGPVMDMADIAVDPHYAERGTIAELDGTPMQALIARLSATPGALRWAGRELDADGDEIRSRGWGG